MFKNARTTFPLYIMLLIVLLGVIGMVSGWVKLREGRRPLWGQIAVRSEQRDRLRKIISIDTDAIVEVISSKKHPNRKSHNIRKTEEGREHEESDTENDKPAKHRSTIHHQKSTRDKSLEEDDEQESQLDKHHHQKSTRDKSLEEDDEQESQLDKHHHQKSTRDKSLEEGDEQENHLDNNKRHHHHHQHHHKKESTEGLGSEKSRYRRLKNSKPTSITVGTSLKTCDKGDLLCDKQLLSLMSYAGFSNDIHIFGSPTGSEMSDSDYLSSLSDVVTVHADCRKSQSGIPLLSDIVKTLYDTEYQNSDAVLFVNGDIILPPHQVTRSYKMLQKTFTEFFAIGHRTTVDITSLRKAAEKKLTNEFWEKLSEVVEEQKGDRTDAEDYFLWSRDFFDREAFPDFRIGRPAFDNWLVNKAIHTRKPVVDLSSSITAIHQKHDYNHIKESKGNKYWKTEDQEKNYALGKSNGGWQHGLIEFSTWIVKPTDCALQSLSQIDWDGDCSIEWNDMWKPLKGFFSTVSEAKDANLKYRRKSHKKKHKKKPVDDSQ